MSKVALSNQKINYVSATLFSRKNDLKVQQYYIYYCFNMFELTVENICFVNHKTSCYFSVFKQGHNIMLIIEFIKKTRFLQIL